MRGVANQPPPPPPPQPRPNLNLSPPSKFYGIPSELPMFKLCLYQFLMGNFNTYGDNTSQLLFAGSLLEGSAGQWYSTLVDPTLLLPPSYTLDSFWQELEDFFGEGVTLQSRERSLDVLRQTGRGVCQNSPSPSKTSLPPSLLAGLTTPSSMFFQRNLRRW